MIILLVVLVGAITWCLGYIQGHERASQFAADVVDRQLGEIRDFRARRATRAA